MPEHQLSLTSPILPAAVAVFSALVLCDVAAACTACGGWGTHGDDVGGATLQQRVDAFNSDLAPGQLLAGKFPGGGGEALLAPGGTQQVWLDFTQSVGYSKAMRQQVLAGVDAVYDGFDAAFSLSQPSGAFTRIIYDGGGLGGVANEIDFRNLNPRSFAFVGTDVGGLTSNQRVNYAVNVGAHELGHTLGLQHHDSFGPVGSGLPGDLNLQARFAPDYPGPEQGEEFFQNIMSTPAFGGQPSVDEFLNGRAALSERSLTKLAFITDGSVSDEAAGDNGSVAAAQVLDLAVLPVPNTRPQDTANGGTGEFLPVRAASIVGDLTGGDSDFFAIEAFEGDFLSVEVMSFALDRIGDPVDSIARVFAADGTPVDYYGQAAVNDDDAEGLDSHIFDLIMPVTGTYFIEVDAFGTSTGDYEMFAWTFGTVPEPTSLALLGAGGIALLRRRR